MKGTLSIAVACLWLAIPAKAEEFGRIEASLDGEARTWYTLTIAQGAERDASATFSSGQFSSDLHIQGHPSPSFTTTDVLSIDLMYPARFAPGTDPMAVELIYMPTGMSPPFWSSDGAPQPATVSFDEMTVEGEIGRASGTFSAMLCLVETFTSDPDPTRCQPIEGRFDTQLLIEEN